MECTRPRQHVVSKLWWQRMRDGISKYRYSPFSMQYLNIDIAHLIQIYIFQYCDNLNCIHLNSLATQLLRSRSIDVTVVLHYIKNYLTGDKR